MTDNSTPPPDLLDGDFQGNTPLATLLRLCRPYTRQLGLASFFQLVKNSIDWLRPVLVAQIIDIITYPEAYPAKDLLVYGAILSITVVQIVPSYYLYVRFSSAATRGIEVVLRSSMTRRLQHLSIGFYQQNKTGALQNKLLRDVESIQKLVEFLFRVCPTVFVTLVVAIAVTSVRDPGFLLFFLGTIPTGLLLARTFREPLRDRNRAFRVQLESMSSRLIEMIGLIPVTRAHGVEDAEIERIERQLAQTKEVGISLDGINALASSSSQVTLAMFRVACLLIAAWFVYHGTFGMTVGDAILLTGYFDVLTNSVTQLVTRLSDVGRGFEAIRSIGEILECPDLEQNQGKAAVDRVEGGFAFESVNFSYPESDRHALYDFSLEVNPGETLAIVGPSGAGKSTLLNLAIGFLRPNQGRILLDGRDMNELDLRTYRQRLAVVSQDTILFEGTIKNNILYGTDEVSDEGFEKAVRDANASEFIDRLPQGYDTIIGENGAKLSGGQRQRIAIARALIRNPKVLILDEATSSLDMASEALIQEALIRLMTDRTTFVVAHRLSTIRWADRIAVLDKGKLVEIGSHEALLAKENGMYARLHALQPASNLAWQSA